MRAAWLIPETIGSRISVNNQLKVEEIVNIAHEAGGAILEIYKQKDLEVTMKDDVSPLTHADMASHHLIIDALHRLTPVLPVLSEESGAIPYEERKKWSTYWLVDPLDGTKEFLRRNGEFTVNIALIKNGCPVLGVVHAPAIEVTYYGEANMGAYKQVQNGKPIPIKVSDYHAPKLKIVISRLHAVDAVGNLLKKINDYECMSMGSSLKLCLVAEGAAHLYPRLGPTMEWDTAAAQCVVECAGGSVTDLDGNVLRYNKADLLNPGFMVCGFPPYPWQSLIKQGAISNAQ